MNLLPFIYREMRVSGRKPATWRARAAVSALAVLAVGWGILTWSGWGLGANPGRGMFHLLAWAAFAGCALAGVIQLGDSLSREKREGTLHLLYLTRLRSAELAAGRFAAGGIIPANLLIALVPALFTCVLLGGVTPGQFGRVALALAHTLFFSLAVSLAVTAACVRQIPAYGGAFMAMLAAMAGALPPSLLQRLPWLEASALFLPSHPFGIALRSPAATPKFWVSLLAGQAAAWLVLWVAARRIAASWRSLPKLPHRSAIAAARPESFAASAEEAAWRAGKPFFWLWMRRAPQPLWLWWRLGLGLAGLLLLREAVSPFLWLGLLASAHVVLRCWAAVLACQALSRQKREGALELLLTAPINAEEVIDGAKAALWRRARLCAFSLGTLHALLAVEQWLAGSPGLALLMAGWGVLAVTDTRALIGVGLWRGLFNANPALAAARTLFQATGLPALAAFIVSLVLVRSQPVEAALTWAGVWIAGSQIIRANAIASLRTNFRELALRPFSEKPKPVGNPWSAINWEEEEKPAAAGR